MDDEWNMGSQKKDWFASLTYGPSSWLQKLICFNIVVSVVKKQWDDNLMMLGYNP